MPQSNTNNSSLKEQQQAVKVVPYDQYYEDSTIDLYEIWIPIWNKKWLIIAITVLSALGSVIYALQLQKIYKAETLLLPPKEKNFQSLNLAGIKELATPDIENKMNTRFNSLGIFKIFKQNLNSRTLHKKFIKEYGLMEILAPNRTPDTRDVDIYSGFTGLINVLEDEGVTSLSIELYDPEISAKWVNDFTNFVDKETVSMLVEDLQNSIENRIREIEYSIESKRFIAEKRRKDQIIRYSENAEIAKQLGIIGRVDATNIIQTTQMNVDIANASSPLYYLGYEALMTEINILRSRKSDDAFIIGLRDMQEQLEKLNSIKFDFDKMSSVRIDQEAYPPKFPIKPNRRLIVTLVTLVGLFSAICLIFIIEFIKNQRIKHSE
tara:strand:- start:525 stop:1661 length:1137 start_codon:yes stop_codon:yes gene_type:complete